METNYHVYSADGFESAHRMQVAAERAALRGNKRRGVEYRVVECDAYGITGGGRGTVRARFGATGTPGPGQ